MSYQIDLLDTMGHVSGCELLIPFFELNLIPFFKLNLANPYTTQIQQINLWHTDK